MNFDQWNIDDVIIGKGLSRKSPRYNSIVVTRDVESGASDIGDKVGFKFVLSTRCC